jgi:hypothetical protein
MTRLRAIALNFAAFTAGGSLVGALVGFGVVVFYGVRNDLTEGIIQAAPWAVLIGTVLGFLLGVCVSVTTGLVLLLPEAVGRGVRRSVHAASAGFGAVPAAIFLIAAILFANPWIVSAIAATFAAVIAATVVFPLISPEERSGSGGRRDRNAQEREPGHLSKTV